MINRTQALFLYKADVYDSAGNRLSKTVDGKTTEYLNDINLPYTQVLQTYGEDDKVQSTYTYGVQRIKSQGEINETYLYDGHGSVSGVVNDSSKVINYSYTAYGDLLPDSSTPNTFGYNAEATDFNTGLQYLRARYYNTNTGRFIQKDEYNGDFTQPGTLNRYAYCAGNPVNRIDPSGYMVRKKEVKDANQAMRDAQATALDYYNIYLDVRDLWEERTKKYNRLTEKLKEAEAAYVFAAGKANTYNHRHGIDLGELKATCDELRQELYLVGEAVAESGRHLCDVKSNYDEKSALWKDAREHYIDIKSQYDEDIRLAEIISESEELRSLLGFSTNDYSDAESIHEAISDLEDGIVYRENGYPEIFQNAGDAWSSVKYSNRNNYGTISSSACNAMSAAMAMYQATGYATPYEAILFALGEHPLSKMNYRAAVSSGVDTQFFTDYPAIYGITTQVYEAGYFTNNADNKQEALSALITALENDGSAIVRAGSTSKYTKSGHYIAVVGYTYDPFKNEYFFTVNDPNYYNYDDIMGEDAKNTYDDIFDDSKNLFIFDPKY